MPASNIDFMHLLLAAFVILIRGKREFYPARYMHVCFVDLVERL
jgi:hypothetical protein